MTEVKGSPVSEGNPALTILIVVVGVVVLFLCTNVALWYWAQRNAPPKPKKRIGVKKARKEKLKMGVQPAGDQ